MPPLEPTRPVKLQPVEPTDVLGPPPPSHAVRAASILLVAAALLTVATIGLFVVGGEYAERTYFNAVGQGLIQNETSFAAVGSTAQLCCGICGLAVAVAFLVFARQAWSARNAVRIWIWVIGGFALLCFGGPAAFTSADDGIRGAVTAYPTWFLPVFRVTSFTMCACLLAVIILLATPAANDFFRSTSGP